MFTIIVALLVVILCFFLWKRQREDSGPHTTIPGPKKGSKTAMIFDKNDVQKQMNFLKELHDQYGPIASFWEGDQMSVSIASPEFFKETRNINTIPSAIFEPFRELIGDDGFAFQDTEEVLNRRKLYDQYFMMKACKTHYDVVKETAEEFVSKWKNNTEKDEIPLVDSVNMASYKSVLRVTFGEIFANEEILNKFKKEFEVIFSTLGLSVTPGSSEEKARNHAIKVLKDIVREAFVTRQKEIEEGSDREIFIDSLLDLPESQRVADGFIFFLGADTIILLVSWFFYHLAKSPDVQEKIYQEIKTVAGEESINLENYSKLTYLRQVIDETLRYHAIIHVGRTAEKDITVGGHFVPKGTPIYQYIGLAHHDANIWKEPKNFDPERFNKENSKGRHAFAFKPFGFSGKRVCPGMTFSYFFITMLSAIWLQKFKLALIPGHELVLVKGFIDRPAELMINVLPRK